MLSSTGFRTRQFLSMFQGTAIQQISGDPRSPGKYGNWRAAPIDDDLINALHSSELEQSADIIVALEHSADDFRKIPPDLNSCLANARVALETLCRSIASRSTGKDYEDRAGCFPLSAFEETY